jgi:hypothetical protein
MSNSVSAQHPAVVLRSSYEHVRALLAIATVAIVGLTIAVTVLAINTASGRTGIPAGRITQSVVHASGALAITANPDQRGPQPTPSNPTASKLRPIVSYPGHF